jgi:hypothetical protein
VYVSLLDRFTKSGRCAPLNVGLLGDPGRHCRLRQQFDDPVLTTVDFSAFRNDRDSKDQGSGRGGRYSQV